MHEVYQTISAPSPNFHVTESDVTLLFQRWDLYYCLVEDYSRNISEKKKKKKKKVCQNICDEIEMMAYFHSSHYKTMETLSCNKKKKKKKTIFVEANIMTIYTKFQLYPPYGLWGEDFLIFFFRKFSGSVVMAINQIQRFGHNSYGW